MKANNFTLPSTNKSNYTLKDSIGKYVVIYFYPKDDTWIRDRNNMKTLTTEKVFKTLIERLKNESK